MKKGKFYTTLIGAAGVLIFSLAATSVMTNHLADSLLTVESASLYELTLNNSNKLTNSSYGSGTKKVKTNPLNNDFSISYNDAMSPVENNKTGFAQLKKSTGYIYSTNGVKGLKSIKLEYVSTTDVKVFFSSSSTFSGSGTTVSSGDTINATGNYFKIMVGSKFAVLTSVTIKYDCDGVEPGGGGGGSVDPDDPPAQENYFEITPANYNESALGWEASNLYANTNSSYADVEFGMGAQSYIHFSDYYLGISKFQVTFYRYENEIALYKGSSDAGTALTYVKTVDPSDSTKITYTWTISPTVDELYLKQTDESHGLWIFGIKVYYTSIISLDPSSLSLPATSTVAAGSSIKLNPTILPKGAVASLTWSSSSEDIATVAQDGTVTGLAVGTSTITATNDEFSLEASCLITVVEPGTNYGSFDEPTVGPSISEEVNYKTINNSGWCDTLDTTKANAEILVVPVQLSDYPFSSIYQETGSKSSQQILNEDFGKAFNGDGASETGYWESLSSYYRKSSFGKFNLHAEIAPILDAGYTAQGLYNAHSSDTTEASNEMLRKAITQYKNANGSGSTKKFDSDGDGLVDAVVMIYSCPNFTNDSAIKSFDEDQLYWAYCFWDYNKFNSASVSSPIGNNYFWASYDFLYEAGGSAPGVSVDPHTLIHESGHMMGLDDYYSYDNDRCPAGGLDMMDFNIGDHNPFSKMILGWTSPYVVRGDASITIKPSEYNEATGEGGDCILIADNWNGSAFDEYFILDLYTPTGLNELDATTKYSTRPKMYTEAGVRLYHVDARLAYEDESENTNYVSSLPSSLDPDYTYYVAASNSKGSNYESGVAYGKGYDLIHLIEADKSDSIGKSSSAYASNKSLFKTGDVFSMNAYQNCFVNKTKMNSGAFFPYEIHFDSVSSTSATIRFVKI